jgi:hypothetical protein
MKILLENSFSRLRRKKGEDFQGAIAPWIPAFKKEGPHVATPWIAKIQDRKDSQRVSAPRSGKIQDRKNSQRIPASWSGKNQDRKDERRSRESFQEKINFKGLCPLKFGGTHA